MTHGSFGFCHTLLLICINAYAFCGLYIASTSFSFTVRVFTMRLYASVFGIITAAFALSPLPVNALEKGSWLVRFGSATVQPNESSDHIDVAGLATLDGVDVGSDTQLGLTVSHVLTDHLAVELLAATPFTHDIDVKNTGIRAGKTSHLPPTLSLQYYFNNSGSAFQPYAGVGVNYTLFFKESVSSDLNSALDGIVGLPAGTVDAGLELDDSFGLALQLGFDYQLNEHWLLNAAIRYIDIDTRATIKTAVADVSFDVDIDPYVYMVGLAYKF